MIGTVPDVCNKTYSAAKPKKIRPTTAAPFEPLISLRNEASTAKGDIAKPVFSAPTNRIYHDERSCARIESPPSPPSATNAIELGQVLASLTNYRVA